MSKEGNELYAFGPYILNVQERRLERAGRKPDGTLRDKPFQTLCVLVRNHGHLVTKQELLDTVWPDSFVEENNLDKCIHTIRQALGERPRRKYIETVPKHGYRFIADVRRISRSEESFDEAPATELGTRSEPVDARPTATTRGRTLVLMGGMFLLFASIVVAYLYKGSIATMGAVKSIAILPVKPIDSSIRDELYEIGTTDSLINRVNSVRGFVVRPLNAVRKYTDIGLDPLAAGLEQRVDYVLDSNYQLADGKFRVTSRLINVATGEAEETYKTESDASSVFAMQDAVASEVGNRLLTRFGAKRSGEWAKRGTENEEAYRLYLRGIYFYDKRDPEPLHKAVESFEQAVQLDPKYALAWAGKALAHRAVTINGRRDDLRLEHERATEAVNIALSLDPELPEAFIALCESKLLYEWDFAGAEQVCKHAIELDANSSLAHQTYARLLVGRGRFDEAISEIKIAIDLEPASLYSQELYGVYLMLARRYDKAIEQFRRAIEMDEDHNRNYMLLSMTLALSGDEEEAFRVYMSSPERRNADDETVRAFETAFRTSGWWRGVMRERANRFEDADRVYYVAALWNGLAGDKDKAFEYLEKSYQRREWILQWLKVDPRLDPLRDDPRFQDLVNRVEPR